MQLRYAIVQFMQLCQQNNTTAWLAFDLVPRLKREHLDIIPNRPMSPWCIHSSPTKGDLVGIHSSSTDPRKRIAAFPALPEGIARWWESKT